MGGLYLRVKTGGYRPGSEIKNRDKTGVKAGYEEK